MTTERSESDAGDVAPASPGPRAGAGSRWKAAAVLAAVFLLGGAAGGAVGRITAIRDFGRVMEGPPAEARARFRMEAMRRHLGLTEEQTAKVRAILDEADAERDRLAASCEPGLEDLRKRTDARMREVLSEDQKKRLDELDARRGRPGGRHGGRPPPGGPPGLGPPGMPPPPP